MTHRAQTAAVIVLLGVTGLIFVLVGDNGVSTGVFLPEPTLTLTPTPIPTATPLPEPSADSWTESTTGQLTYVDPNVAAQIAYQTTTLDLFVTQSELEMPASDEPYPLQNLLSQTHDDWQATISGWNMSDFDLESFEGPQIKIVGGVLVHYLHLEITPQSYVGGDFPGVEMILAMFEAGEDEVVVVQYSLEGEANPLARRDFWSWLEANAPRLAAGAAEEATEEAVEPQATEESVEPQATEEAAEPQATEEVSAAATEEAVEPQATEEASADATEEAVEPQATEEVSAAATEEAAAPDEGAPVALGADAWLEVTPGQLMYMANQELPVSILYATFNLADFVADSQFTMPPEDAEEPLLYVMRQLRTMLETDIGASGLVLDPEAFQGPELKMVGDVPVYALSLQAENRTDPNSQAFAGIDMVMAMIDAGYGNVTVIRFILQGEPIATVHEDFDAWLEENAPRLATAVPTPEPTTAPQ